MTRIPEDAVVRIVRSAATRLTGAPADLLPLLDRVSDARLVLLGEPSIGSHEGYRLRADITRRLLGECGFSAVALADDWDDAAVLDRFVGGRTRTLDARPHFPQWRWRNTEVVEFAAWVRAYNAGVASPATRVGIFGLDTHGLHGAMATVAAVLREHEATADVHARERFACLDHVGGDPQEYGWAMALGLSPARERAVLDRLAAAREAALAEALEAGDLAFTAERLALAHVEGEAYDRAMFNEPLSSWNLRMRHMADTLDALLAHLGRDGRPARIVVWAHNTEVGDARATALGRRGEVTLGQLARERHGSAAVLVGMTTYHGTVSAASTWDAPVERKLLRPALPGSHEAIFHESGLGNFYLDLHRQPEAMLLGDPRLERSVGVVYRPETERLSHYFYAGLPEQFDAIFHLDRTRAVEPLEHTPVWRTGEQPVPRGLTTRP